MKYRLPDGTESAQILGPAWVARVGQDSWRSKRGRPPENYLTEEEATARLRTFLDQQSERTPPARVTFDRCVDAFIERCEEKGRSPNTLRTYRQIARELKARWEDCGPSTSTPTSSRTTAMGSPSGASQAAHSTSAVRCCRASSRSPAGASR
jgi:hypothetical protein